MYAECNQLVAKSKKQIFRDEGEGETTLSLEFAKQHLEELSESTVLQAQFKTDAKGDWQEYNVRFYTPLGQEFWFSGLNCGYRGHGPRTLIKILKLIKWTINQEVVFQNEKLQVARELPSVGTEEENEG